MGSLYYMGDDFPMKMWMNILKWQLFLYFF